MHLPGYLTPWGAGLIFLCVAGMTAQAETSATGEVDFNRDIRPIISKSCFACHGPDAEHREAGLRLDERDAAIAELDSGERALVPGEPDSSELIRRVSAAEPADRMPPSDSGHALDSIQIELLRKWIEQGANYAQHWAFVPPERPSLPAVSHPELVRNPIDRFVLAKLEQEQLSPSPEADRYMLVRRLSLDLRGLPPTPEEVAEFVNDSSPDAYEKLVDRYLADPAYGERWARPWLDLARFADSQGYGFDITRSIWRYRDWVIDALNANLPFDRFTVEQIAGDLLENPTLEQRIATAFHRNTMTNVEGVEDESRVAAVKDRAETTFQVWMGLTLGCAKCHDHKFDPLSQREYYQIYAFLNQTADGKESDDLPLLPAPTYAMSRQLAVMDKQTEEARREFAVDPELLPREQVAWEESIGPEPEWVVVRPEEMKAESEAELTILDDGSVFVSGDPASQDGYTLTARIPGADVTAFRLETIPDPNLPYESAGRSPEGKFVLSHFSAKIARPTSATSDKVPQTDESPLAPIEFSDALADFSEEKFPVEAALKKNQLSQAGWAVDSRKTEPHVAMFLVKQDSGEAAPSVPENSAEEVLLEVKLEHRYLLPRHALGRFRLSITSHPQAESQLRIPREVRDLLAVPVEERTPEQAALVTDYFRTIAPCLQPLRDRLAEIDKQRPQIPTVPVMMELAADEQRSTAVLQGGNHLMPGEAVTAALPASLPPLPEGAPSNRLGLAKWLVSRDNPLTARVTVNRYWSQLFGIGLVETEEDFGTQGELPTHPELLDWLAVEFMEPEAGGIAWDVKRLLKTIVCSATYRQSSVVSAESLSRDPRNRWLSHGPRFRLEAEMVRDQALALSGLLSRKLRGPSVYPPQPDGVWQIAFSFDRKWPTSEGEDRYRRGLYTFIRRSAPYPSLMTFDATSREICTVRRVRTNTPLQALVTLNDPVYVEAAQALARRIVREGGDTLESRARFGLQLCLVQPPSDVEVQELLQLFGGALGDAARDPASALTLATDPLGPLPPNMPAIELAAWTVVANVLLNLDGVLSRN